MNEYPIDSNVTAVFRFDLDSLRVRNDMLGKVIKTQRAELPVEVRFPQLMERIEGRLATLGHHGKSDQPDSLTVVSIVEVRVFTKMAVGNEEDGRLLLDVAEPIAREVIRSLLDWARTQDSQPWLPPAHIQPKPERSVLLEGSEGKVIPFERGFDVRVLIGPGLPSGAVSDGSLDTPIDEAASLLAEARWAVWPERDPDSKRAVLLAATALEVKASDALREVAGEEASAIVDVALGEEPSVKAMLTKYAKAIWGESLKEHDGHLMKEIGKLFDLRNDVAHRGMTPGASEARRGVKAAEGAFAWLAERAAN